jgi:hypothetical protein
MVALAHARPCARLGFVLLKPRTFVSQSPDEKRVLCAHEMHDVRMRLAVRYYYHLAATFSNFSSGRTPLYVLMVAAP